MVGNRPVCDKNWDTVDAQVVCRDLGHSDATKAIPMTNSAFGGVKKNFLIDDVQCTGSEYKLQQCAYKTRPDCGGADAAGVVCIDNSKLRLVGGGLREGNVFIGDQPVCHDLWDISDGQVVCNSLFVREFSSREGQIVPVISVTHNSFYGNSSTDEFVLNDVVCNGKESSLTDCQFITHDKENCDRHQVAGVSCAKCTPNDLIEIVKSVLVDNSIKFTKSKIINAQTSLKSKCHHWDCTKMALEYPEYCQVKAFLQDAWYIINEDFEKTQVTLRFDPGKLLDHEFTKEQSGKLLVRIDQLQEQSQQFQEQLAEYYKTMANFDGDKAKKDFKSNSGSWSDQRRTIEEKMVTMGPDLTKLYHFAFAAQSAELAEKVTQAVLSFVSLFKPADAVMNPGSASSAISNVMDKLGNLADSTATMAELSFIFTQTLPRMKNLCEQIQTQFIENANVYAKISAIAEIDNFDHYTTEKSKAFLDAYEKYHPSINVEQLSEFDILMKQVVEDTCHILTSSGGGSVKAAIRMAATDLCPSLLQKSAILRDLMKSTKDLENNMVDSLASTVRAKLSQTAAQGVSRVIGRSSNEIVERAIAKQFGKILFQIHKTKLIKIACDNIKYMHYGVEQDICKQLRENPFMDLGNLVAFHYGDDIMCQDSLTRSGEFRIPAIMRRGNESIPSGVLDLGQHLDPHRKRNHALFQIPNAAWLVQNGWIDEDEIDEGPFFVKQLQIFPLPIMSGDGKKTDTVSTSLSVVQNVVDGDDYRFDADVSNLFAYDENDIRCNDRKKSVSPYSLRNCGKLPDICRRSDGFFAGPIYPSLMSLWNVSFDIPTDYKRIKPFPVGTFYLQAEAEICFRYNGRMTGFHRDTKMRNHNRSCCSDSGRYADANEDCQLCPVGSSPRLNGYFCESCPPGYQPADGARESYGCGPCPVDTFKESDGNSACKPCEEGKHTENLLGRKHCFGKQFDSE